MIVDHVHCHPVPARSCSFSESFSPRIVTVIRKYDKIRDAKDDRFARAEDDDSSCSEGLFNFLGRFDEAEAKRGTYWRSDVGGESGDPNGVRLKRR